VLIVLFILFWATSAAGALNASRVFVSLFTPAPVSSHAALIGGGPGPWRSALRSACLAPHPITCSVLQSSADRPRRLV
jgi:hypothetical protein